MKKLFLVLVLVGFSGVQLRSDHDSQINVSCRNAFMAIIQNTQNGNDSGNLTGCWIPSSKANETYLQTIIAATHVYQALRCYERGIR